MSFDFQEGVRTVGVFWRWISRVSFFVIAAAIFFSVIRYPQTSGATLHTLGEIPLNRAATETVRPLTRPMASLAALPAEAPGEEPAPAVQGDILGLMYHDLTDDPQKGTAWTTTGEKFREDIEALLGAGYRPLSVEDYLDGAYRAGQDYFIVTFDDGYLSNLTMALPILTEMGVPATVFVITGSEPLDNHMSWDELRTFDASELTSVYSHTDTHITAGAVSLDAFLRDEAAAWAKLTEHVSPARKILSYPGGSYTKESMEALAADGYELFVIQERPWWYKEENEDGIRVLVRQNVSFDADILKIAETNRRWTGLPTLEEAAVLRERHAAEEREALLRMYEKWLAYDYARYNRIEKMK